MLSLILYFAVKSDLADRTIPDECSLFICALAVGAGGFDLQRLSLALFVMTLLSLVMGFGDAKLLGALTLLLGSSIFHVIMLAYVLACVYCLFRVSFGKLFHCPLSFHDSIPFAPFIAPAAVTVFAEAILSKNLYFAFV